MKTRRSLMQLVILGMVGMLLMSGCGAGEGTSSTDGGAATTTTVGPTSPVPASIALLVSSPQLNSDVVGAPTVTLTAIVKDSGNRALKEVDVSFTADSGTLRVTGDPTDENGRVTATLDAGGDPTFRQINLTASAGSISSSNMVTVTGTTLSITGSASLSFGDTAPLTIFLKDSAGNGIAGKTITIASAKGNTLSPGPYVTNSSGQVTVNVTAAVGGSDTITASVIGVTSTFALTVNAAILKFVTPVSATEIPIGTSQAVTVDYSVSGAPQVGMMVNFVATRGALSSTTAATGADGRATVTISSTQSGPGLLLATISGGPSSQLAIEFVATTVSAVEVKASPATIGTNSAGLTSEQSLITAVVRDASNNLVKNKTVTFRIVNDASGGSLSPAAAVTDSSGTANSYFTAGASSGPLGGVTIRASVSGTTVTGDTSLTVAKKSLFITLFTGQEVGKLTSNRYQKDFVALVTDSAGAPVVGAPVVATVTPVYYQKGWMTFDTYWTPVVTLQRTTSTLPSVPACANEDGITNNPLYDYNGLLDQEDRNHNGILDPGEDLNGNGILDPGEDQNGNNRLDPGNAVSVTATPTDSTGHSTVSIVYARDLAYWLNVKLEAFTSNLMGSTASAVATFTLTGAADDYKDETVAPPGDPSPFGVSSSCYVDLTVTAMSSSQMAVTWQKTVTAASYNVYRGGALIRSTTTNTLTDTGLAGGTQYCYEIRTVNAAGTEQVFTPTICGTTSQGSTTLPPTPTGLTVTALSSTQIQVSWTAATGASSYRIYRNDTHLQYATATGIMDTGLTANALYCYAVASVDAVGSESVKSSQMCATTYAEAPVSTPVAPTGLTAAAVSAVQIDLAWTASVGGAQGYNVYRNRLDSDGAYVGWVLLGSVSGATTSVSDMAGVWGYGTTDGYPDGEGAPMTKTRYCYRLAAWNVAGNESTFSDAYCVTTP